MRNLVITTYLGLFVVLASTSCATSPATKKAVAAERAAEKAAYVAVPADFLAQESRHYQALEPLVLACTIQANAKAGAVWIGATLGKNFNAKNSAEALAALAEAVALPKKISIGELADLGWFLAEHLRLKSGAQLLWQPARKQVVLRAAGSEVSPLGAIVKLRTGKADLDEIVEMVKGAVRSEVVACKDVAIPDIIRARGPLHPRKKRRLGR